MHREGFAAGFAVRFLEAHCHGHLDDNQGTNYSVAEAVLPRCQGTLAGSAMAKASSEAQCGEEIRPTRVATGSLQERLAMGV